MWKLLVVAFVATCAAVHIPGVPQEFSTNDIILSAIADEIAQKFANEYISYMKTGVESASLRQISNQLAKSHSKKDLFTMELDELSAGDQFFACTTCRATVNVIGRMFREDGGELNGPNKVEAAKGMMLDICDRLNIQTQEVCSGLFDFNWPTADYIFQNTEIDSRSFCSIFMEFNFCNVKDPNYNWTLIIDAGGAAVTGPKSDLPKKSTDDLTILHLTDIHYDPLYEPGALAECDEPQCCQRHKDTTESSKAAGYWGDYRNCDMPWHTIDNAFEHIKSTHPKIDYIYQTGDVVDHMVWATSIQKNTDVLSKVNKRLAELFPDIPVYPCIGNHEPHPLNVFSPEDVPEEINVRWMYEHLYNDWSVWLPANTKETILKGGYYTVSPKKGFRVIALNNNDCYTDNLWLYYSGTYQIPQLQWLHDTLLAAEQAGEYVHILGHIPSGDGTCWSTWAREYNRLIERFSQTISGVFSGHSHKDEMNVHYSSKGHAVGMTWNGGALTTFSFKNPNYRLYEVEPSTMQVVDHETWIFDLNEANEAGASQQPNWQREYVFGAEFTEDLSPAGIDKLLDEMAQNPDTLRKFWRFKMTSSDPKLQEDCDRACLLSTICRIAVTVNNQRQRCVALQTKLSAALDDENTTQAPNTSTTPTTPTTTASGETTTGDSGGETTTEDPDDGATTLSVSLLTLAVAMLTLLFHNL